jgi:hypothetical protein
VANERQHAEVVSTDDLSVVRLEMANTQWPMSDNMPTSSAGTISAPCRSLAIDH